MPNGVPAVSRYSTTIRWAHTENAVLMHIPEISAITLAICGSRP
jgi:hypothetical protein